MVLLVVKRKSINQLVTKEECGKGVFKTLEASHALNAMKIGCYHIWIRLPPSAKFTDSARETLKREHL